MKLILIICVFSVSLSSLVIHYLFCLRSFSQFFSICRHLDPVPHGGTFGDIALIVDGTDCPINRPGTREERNLFTNGRNKENISSRYVVVVVEVVCNVM